MESLGKLLSTKLLHRCEAEPGCTAIAAEGPGVANEGKPKKTADAQELQELLTEKTCP